jgi:hypothetical protein
MLLMKREFFEDVRSGAKTTTLRYWRWCRTPAESVHTVPGLGKVRIDSARPVELAELTDEDAQADGFQDLAALRAALRKLYPSRKRRGRQLYLIHFTYVPDGPAF